MELLIMLGPSVLFWISMNGAFFAAFKDPSRTFQISLAELMTWAIVFGALLIGGLIMTAEGLPRGARSPYEGPYHSSIFLMFLVHAVGLNVAVKMSHPRPFASLLVSIPAAPIIGVPFLLGSWILERDHGIVEYPLQFVICLTNMNRSSVVRPVL
jgi:hypothetical protein